LRRPAFDPLTARAKCHVVNQRHGVLRIVLATSVTTPCASCFSTAFQSFSAELPRSGIDDRVAYFSRLKSSLRLGGRLATLDFKTREIAISDGCLSSVQQPLSNTPGSIRKSIPGS
jgi:hypothetical protein